MQFVSFLLDESPALGLLEDGQVYPLKTLLADAPDTMVGVIEGGDSLKSAIAAARGDQMVSAGALDTLVLLPILPAPGKIFCVGLNYIEHAKEGGHADLPPYPTLFLRTAASLAGHGQTIVKPLISDQLDFEAELAVVIGKRAAAVSQDDALDYVYGYTPFNDISVRDFQRRGTQWTPGKNFDRTGPMGPALVTADELPEGAVGLSIQARLNGQVMQSANTTDMIFNVRRIIAEISQFTTLEAGDVIATGTPSGVGFARKPPVWMKPGDVIEVEIEGLPVLRNTIG